MLDGSNVTLEISDHKGTPIPLKDFGGIVKTFHKSDFTLVVDYASTAFKYKPAVVTPGVFYTH